MQVAIGVVLTVFFARFWTSHLGNLPLVLSGITLHAYSVALIISGVTELLLVIRTDYAAQVVTIQKYVTLLRQWRVGRRLLVGLAPMLLWGPGVPGLLAWGDVDRGSVVVGKRVGGRVETGGRRYNKKKTTAAIARHT